LIGAEWQMLPDHSRDFPAQLISFAQTKAAEHPVPLDDGMASSQHQHV